MKMLDQLLQLATLGYHVHPLKVGAKGPRTPHGHHDATTDAAIIRDWWEDLPSGNAGCALEASGLLVVGPDNAQRLAEFEALGLPDTMIVQSGSGPDHRHYYYRRPDGCPIHRLCISKQYDVLTNGYTVVPPSVTDGPYLFLTPPRPIIALPEAPAWAVTMLVEAVEREAAKPAPTPRPTISLSLSDQDIRDRLFRSKHGGRIQALYNGDVTAHNGYDKSQSGAELALLSAFTFYTDDEAQLDRLFLSAPLARPQKWRGSYRAATLRKALSRQDHYIPPAPKGPIRPTLILAHADQQADQEHDQLVVEQPVVAQQAVDQTDSCAERVRQLEQHIARLEAFADQVEAERDAEQELRIAAEDRHRALMAAMRCENPSIRKLVPTAAAIGYLFDAAASQDAAPHPRFARMLGPDGSLRVTRRTLSEQSGRSEDTISTDLKLLKDHGLIEETVTRLAPGDLDPDTGEVLDQFVSVLRVRPLRSTAETLRYLAEQPKPEKGSRGAWGGPREQCQHCGSDRLAVVCLDCGRHQDAGDRLKRQLAVSADTPLSPLNVADSSLNRQVAVSEPSTPAGQDGQDAVSPVVILERRRALREARPVQTDAGARSLDMLDQRIVDVVKASHSPLDETAIAQAVGRQPSDVRASVSHLIKRGTLKRWDDGLITAAWAAWMGSD